MSISSLQSARPQKKGEGSFYAGLGFRRPQINNRDEVIAKIRQEVGSRTIAYELGGRLGLAPRADVGIKVALPSIFTTDFKFMLLGKGRPYALSTGIIGSRDLNGLSVRIQDSHVRDEEKVTFSSLSVPVYLTYDLAKLASFHASIRYAQTWAAFEKPTTPTFKGQNIIVALGLAYAFLIGEYAEAIPLGYQDHTLRQVSIGSTSDWAGSSSSRK